MSQLDATQKAEPIPIRMWMAHSTLKFLDRNQKAVLLDGVVHLGHDVVVKVMRNTFEVVLRDAHYVTIAARIVLAERVHGKIFQEEEIFKAEDEINRQLERISDYFDRRIEQAEQKLVGAGFDPEKVPQRTTAYETKASTNAVTAFVEILKKADIYLSLIDYLWIAGELSSTPSEALKARLNNQREVRSHLLSIPRRTTSQFQTIRRICNGVLEQRKKLREEQSARDKSGIGKKVAKPKKGKGQKGMPEQIVLGDDQAPDTPAGIRPGEDAAIAMTVADDGSERITVADVFPPSDSPKGGKVPAMAAS
jgi:hypothetical protein